jgi:hypothetical protein
MTHDGPLPAEAIASLAAEVIALLADRGTEAETFARLLGSLTAPPPLCPEAGEKTQLPVCRYLATALGEATGEASRLVPPLAALCPFLDWTQNPNYRAAPPSPSFLDRYGYAVIAGPKSGPPALRLHPSLAFGVLLLGPDTLYPAHSHPASEIYVPLGRGEWMMGDEPFMAREPGAVIHHRPNLLHATRSGAAPLAALYLWAGDLATYARLVGDAG